MKKHVRTYRTLARRAASLLLAAVMLVPFGIFAPIARAGVVEPSSTETRFVIWSKCDNMQDVGADASYDKTYSRIMFYQTIDGSHYYFNGGGGDGLGDDKVYLDSQDRVEHSAHKEWNAAFGSDRFVTMTGVRTPYLYYAGKSHDYHCWRLWCADKETDNMSNWAICLCDDYEDLDIRYNYGTLDSPYQLYGADNKSFRIDPWIIGKFFIEAVNFNRAMSMDRHVFQHWDNDTGGYNEAIDYDQSDNRFKAFDAGKRWAGIEEFDIYLGQEIPVGTLAENFTVNDDQITTLGRPYYYVPRGKTLTVKSGGVLSIDGILLNDGNIVVEDGGLLVLKDGARVVPYTKYKNGNEYPQGGITSRGTIVVGEDAVLCGGGDTGLFITGGNVTNFGVICAERMTISKSYLVDNRDGAYIVGGLSPSAAMRNQMLLDAFDGKATDTESIRRSIQKVEDTDSITTIDENAVYGNTEGLTIDGKKAVTIGSENNPLMKVYTRATPFDQYELLFEASVDDISFKVEGEKAIYTAEGKTHTIQNRLVSAALGRGGSGTETLFTDMWAGGLDNGWFQFEPQCAPGKRLDCSDTKAPNSANIHLWDANGGMNQLWKLETAGTTASGTQTYRLNTAAYSGSPARGLDLPGTGDVASGNNVSVYTNDGYDDQRWTLVNSSDKGYYYIRNAKNSALNLDVQDAGTANGTNVRVWMSNTSDAQKWRITNRLTEESFARATVAGCALEFRPQHVEKMCLDLTGGSATDGTNIQIYETNNSTAQRWCLEMCGSDPVQGVTTSYYRIVNIGAGTVLDISGSTYKNGANVVGSTIRTGNSNTQYWYLQPNGSAYYITCRGNTDYVLSVANGATGNGGSVVIQTKNDAASQKWHVGGIDDVKKSAEEAMDNTNRDVLGGRTFLIQPSDAPESALFVGGNQGVESGDIWGKTNEKWHVVLLGNDTKKDENGNTVPHPYYRIVCNDLTNTAMQGNQGSVGAGSFVEVWTSNMATEGQQWYIDRNDDGTCTISPRKATDGCVLGIETNSRGSFVKMTEPGSAEAKTWNFVDVTDDRFHSQTVALEPKHAPGMYLSVLASTDGASAQIWTAGTGDLQKWTFVRMGTDVLTETDAEGNKTETEAQYYKVVNEKSGKVLDISDGVAKNSANVIQYTYRATKNQEWFLQDAGDGYYCLASRADPDFVLDVSGYGTEDGANVQIYKNVQTNNDNQKWNLAGYRVVDTDVAGTDPLDGRIFTLEPGHASGMRLDIKGDGKGNGTQVQLYQEQATEVQQWKFVRVGSERIGKSGVETPYYMMLSMHAQGKALDTSTDKPGNGTHPHLWDAKESNQNQHWYLEFLGGGYYNIVPRGHSDLALGCSNGGTGNNTDVILWTKDGTDNQEWRLQESMEVKEIGTFRLEPSHAQNMDLCPLNSANDNGIQLVLWSTRDTDYRLWTFVRMGADSVNGAQKPYYRIVNKGSGKAFDVPGVGASALEKSKQLQQWDYDKGLDQLFYLEDTDDGLYKITCRSDSSLCVACQDGKSADGTKILLASYTGSDGQKWNLISEEEEEVYGTFEVAPVSAPDMRVEVAGGSSSNGANIQVYRRSRTQDNTNDAQCFEFTRIGTDMVDGEAKPYYSVKNTRSNKYWDVPTDAGKITGHNLQQYDNDGYSDMHYYLEEQDDGSYILRNRRDPTLVLTAEGTENETNVKVDTEVAGGSKAQRFVLHPTLPWEVYGDFVLYPMHTYERYEYALGVKGNSGSNGAQVVQAESNGTAYQIWRFTQIGIDNVDGEQLPYYTIKNTGSSKVIDLSGIRMAKKDMFAQQFDWDGAYDQMWYLELSDTDGVYYITARGNRSVCLGVPNNAKAKDTQLKVVAKTNAASQQWLMVSAE